MRNAEEGNLNREHLLPSSAFRVPRLDSKATRNDVEDELSRLLGTAAGELRSRRPQAIQKVELIQQAQLQLKQNVPPALVYDHLLLKISGLGIERREPKTESRELRTER